jgi:hypothetical protein
MKAPLPAIFTFLLLSLAAGAQYAPLPVHGAYVLRSVDGTTICQDATPAEALRINARPNVPLKVFGESHDKVRANASAGLNIILRGTAQLDANPQAKAAFERAADAWESRIANPVTVYVDVDFGTQRFGEDFDENVIAAASSDYRGGDENLYAGVRGLLVAAADNAAEQSIYNALPTTQLPTDLGPTTRVAAPSMLFRAIGGLPSAAASADDAPTIGFNSAFPYDFNPTDGITPGRTDFEGVVIHEIGHMLGFASLVGLSEDEEEDIPVIPTILDFFRFRPGVATANFTTRQRIQSSGGEQVFFAGATPLPFSTGRPDGTGGDEEQASHWKDDALSGVRIGIMDPTLGSGVRTELTANDLAAFAMMGYDVVAPSAGCQESEPNDSPNNASPMTIGTPCTGNVNETDTGGIIVEYDEETDDIEDLFRVTLAAPARLNVNLTFATGDLDLFLFTISGSTPIEVGSATTNANPEGFVTSAPVPAGTYYIGVSAYSGSSSYTLSVTTEGGGGPQPQPQPPAAPANLTATAVSTTSIRLNWTDNSNDESEFRIEQRVGNAFVDIGSAPANSTSFTITGLTPGQTATFRIRARNGNGNSGYSNEASATTPNVPGPCVANATTVCLLSDRFRVSVAFINQFANPPAPGNFLGAKLVAGVQNPDVATFGISSAQAIEVVVRIQDTRPFGLNRFDVYYGGLTDLEYTVTVVDTVTGTTRSYRNPPGTVGGGVDRTSFISN